MFRFLNGTIVLPDGLLAHGEVITLDDRIAFVGPPPMCDPRLA